uniref:Uncharacterized protein n=1 Tax=Accipiter nisus TaxID=211598 RepID=A0A8B9RV14_9AVES
LSNGSCESIRDSYSFPGPSLESEDFNIPPITPPSLPDHSLVHLNEIESGYHSLCHPMNHNGLLPFHPQNMDLPEITVSNMLGQDGTLLSNSLSVVSFFSLSLLFCFKLQNQASSCPTVLVSAGIELTLFLVAGTVLCFEFSMRRMLITHRCFQLLLSSV